MHNLLQTAAVFITLPHPHHHNCDPSLTNSTLDLCNYPENALHISQVLSHIKHFDLSMKNMCKVCSSSAVGTAVVGLGQKICLEACNVIALRSKFVLI